LLEKRRHRGFSLIEVMVVVLIIGLVTGGAVYGIRGLARSELRSSAAKLAGAIRYCFDRSITTGAYFRLVLDLDSNRYSAERSDERVYLIRGKEESPGRGQALDVAALEKKQEEDQALRDSFSQDNSVAAVLEPPPAPRRAKFQSFKDAALPEVKLKGAVRFFDIYTTRQREPYTKGKAYLYFFPDGHTERALIRVSDGDDFYTLIVHPLTGRVEVRSGRIDLPPGFGEHDDEGNRIQER
jgi:general secretion pathway protein H